jgi:Golgi phosphoprotein 3 (GPP34)
VVTLAEDLFLLACDDETGRPFVPPHLLDLGLAGALLFDLVAQERVALANEHVVVSDPEPTGDRLLDTALDTIAGAAKPHDPEYWVRHLAKGTRGAVQERLIAAGVLRLENHKVLGMFPVHWAHEIDQRIERDLLDRLCEAVVLERPADPETAALASLALAIELEWHLFPRSDRRAVQRRVQEIAGDHWVGRAVRQRVLAIDAALGIPGP